MPYHSLGSKAWRLLHVLKVLTTVFPTSSTQPHNIFVDYLHTNSPFLTVDDFGVACAPGLTTGEPGAGGLTVVGTPGYMSPECMVLDMLTDVAVSSGQAKAQQLRALGAYTRGQEREPGVDVWAAGVFFMAMLTGKHTAVRLFFVW